VFDAALRGEALAAAASADVDTPRAAAAYFSSRAHAGICGLLGAPSRHYFAAMPLSKAAAGMALCAVGAGAVLAHGLLPLLRQGAGSGSSFALVRYESFLGIAVAQLLCLAVVWGILR
jgi:hypothetical protein